MKNKNVYPFKPRNNGGQTELGFDPAQATEHLCQCGSEYFDQTFRVRIVSRLAPGNKTGQTLIIPIPVNICRECGKVLNLIDDEKGQGVGN